MKLCLVVVCLMSAVAATADMWTNRLGRAFSAKLIAVDDKGATFVFTEDGATNVLSFSKLSKDSERKVCDIFDFAPVPPRVAATFNRAVSDMKRIRDLREDGLLTAEKAQERQAFVMKVFSEICQEKGIASNVIIRLQKRIR